MTIAIALVLLALMLVLAWFDGGRQEQRLITQPAELQENFS